MESNKRIVDLENFFSAEEEFEVPEELIEHLKWKDIEKFIPKE